MSSVDPVLAWPLRHAPDQQSDWDTQLRRTAAGVYVVEKADGSLGSLGVDHLRLGTLDDAELVRTAAGVLRVQTGAGVLARLDDTTKDALAAVPRTMMDVGSHLNAAPAATRGLGWNTTTLSGSATNVNQLPVRLIDPAALVAMPGKTAKMRISGWAGVNATAPGAGTFTLGIHGVTSVLGPTGVLQYTIGAAQAGTTVQFNGGANLAASTRYSVTGPQFDPLAANHWCIGIVNSGAMAAASVVGIHAWLELLYV